MGRSQADNNRDNEQHTDGPGKKGSKPRNGTGSKKTGNAATPLTIPKNLEDYKGARKQLRHAVKAVVKANSETLAEKIVKKAQDGDVRGTEMMLSLIEKKKAGKEAKKKKREGPSWAELLASEPEWDEEEDGKAKGTAAQSTNGAAEQKVA
ncbi:MAG: hypothetical protein WBP85_03775 [Terracidiphilus sp.]